MTAQTDRQVPHFLSMADLSADDLSAVLERAANPEPPRTLLAGRGAGLIFEKPSARTRNSTDMAFLKIGGHPVTIRPD